MKKIFIALAFTMVMGITSMAQDWSDYNRTSDNWRRHNRDARLRPWRYDRGGRVKKGKPYTRRVTKQRVRSRRRYR